MKVAVGREDFSDTMLEAKGRDVGIVDQIAGDRGMRDEILEHRGMPGRFRLLDPHGRGEGLVSRWDLDRLSRFGDEDRALAEAGLGAWADALDARDPG